MAAPPSETPSSPSSGGRADRPAEPSAGAGLPGAATPRSGLARIRVRGEDAPASVSAAAVLTVLEAAALIGYACAYPFEVLPLGDTAGPKALIAGGVIAFLLITAAGLSGAAWSLLALKRWPLSLIVVAQLVAIPVLLPAARGDLPVLWIAIAAAAAIIVLAFVPTTTAAIRR